jgi:RNA polymerase sigma factor (sigma-70 family)
MRSEHESLAGDGQNTTRLAAVFDAHAAALCRYIQSKVGDAGMAEDLTSQVFLKALRWLDQERSAHSVRGWLYATARTVVADYRRAQGRLATLSLEGLHELPITEDGEHAGNATRVRALWLLGKLPTREREVLTLRYLHGYTAAEIAEALGLTVNHARVLHLRALRHAAHLEHSTGGAFVEPRGMPLTEETMRALAVAAEEARLFQHNYIGTEHVLLGVLHAEDSVPVRALAILGIAPSRVRAGLEFILGPSLKTSSEDRELTRRARTALALAEEEAQALGSLVVAPEHVLLGLVREGTGIAALLLASLDVTVDEVRKATVQVQAGH